MLCNFEGREKYYARSFAYEQNRRIQDWKPLEDSEGERRGIYTLWVNCYKQKKDELMHPSLHFIYLSKNQNGNKQN